MNDHHHRTTPSDLEDQSSPNHTMPPGPVQSTGPFVPDLTNSDDGSNEHRGLTVIEEMHNGPSVCSAGGDLREIEGTL